MFALSEIIEKLEAAKEDAPELDGLIFRATTPGGVWAELEGVWYLRDEEDTIAYEGPKPYTTSLDVALTLVPEGWRVDLRGSASSWYCGVNVLRCKCNGLRR